MYKLLVKHHKSLGHKLRKGMGKPRMLEPGQMRTHEVRDSEMSKLPVLSVGASKRQEMTGGMAKRPLIYKL